MQAGGNVLTYQFATPGISVHRGDLGGVTSDSAAVLNFSGLALPYDIPRGNLRSIEAPQVGSHVTTGSVLLTNADSIDFVVGGTVGLIRSTSALIGFGQIDVNMNAIVLNPDELREIRPMIDGARADGRPHDDERRPSGTFRVDQADRKEGRHERD